MEYANSNQRVPARHNGRLNILLADGHITGVILDRLFNERGDDVLAMWNRDGFPHRERLK